MAWYRRGATNEDLVSKLVESCTISNERVIRAMRVTDRRHYVGPTKSFAYLDRPQPIGFNATISAPHMHGIVLESLAPYLDTGMRALDVGSGSGYLTAAMGRMVGATGKAVGLEHIPELVRASVENVRADCPELLEGGRVVFRVADGRRGWPDDAPYNCIHVGAASAEIPKELVDQLACPGRLVIPVGQATASQMLCLVDKDREGRVSERRLLPVVFVPLTDRESQLRLGP